MLVVYTPDKQDESIEVLYEHTQNLCRYNGVPITCRTDTGIAVKMSWCRELVTDNLRGMLTDASPGIVDMYGIRKHGTSLQHQPKCPGNISQRTEYTDNLLSEFFQLMVECISCILDDNTIKPKRISNWIHRWRMTNFDRKFEMGCNPTGPDIKCILNADKDNIPKLEVSSLWSKSRMFGSITNIPSSWGSCVPVMSYLMYILRLWGVFYSTPRVLPKLSKISRQKYPCQSELLNILGNSSGYTSSSYSSQLWLALARMLMLPSWLTPHGKEYFWTFTYLLINYAIHKTYREETNLEGIKADLYSLGARGGLKSWCKWYRANSEPHVWFKDMLKHLGTYGVSSVLNFDSIVKYI